MAWWDALKTESGYPWNPTPGPGQRNDYSVPLPVGTQVVAPVSGIVLPHHPGGGFYSYFGKQPWGGEVDILTSLPDYPGGMQNVNVLHLDSINVRPGDTVTAGQTVLGTSGGQTSGGNMPSSPVYSSGPHVGVGVHAVSSWDQMYNPDTLVKNLLAGQDRSSVPSNNQLQGAGLGTLPRGGVPNAVPLAQGTPATSGSGTACDQYNGFDPRFYWCKLSQTAFGRFVTNPMRMAKLIGGFIVFSWGVGLFIISLIGPDVAAATVTAAGVPEAAPFAARVVGGRGSVARRIGAGIRTQGAIAGQQTLKAKEEAGASKGRKEVVKLIHEQRSDAAKRAAQTRKVNQQRSKQGLPPLPGSRAKAARAPAPKAVPEPKHETVFVDGKPIGTYDPATGFIKTNAGTYVSPDVPPENPGKDKPDNIARQRQEHLDELDEYRRKLEEGK